MAESLLITPDFEPTENESELIVNNCVLPEAEQSSDSPGTESWAAPSWFVPVFDSFDLIRISLLFL